MKNILLLVSSASGALYAHTFIKTLPKLARLDLIVTEGAARISEDEQQGSYYGYKAVGTCYSAASLYAPPSSGSTFDYDAVVVLPASMGFLARCAAGVSSTLAERAFDVALKESVKTIVCFREFPLSKIHLNTLTTLADAGVIICPLAPSFYTNPTSISELVTQFVGRIQYLAGIENSNYKKWQVNG